MRRLRRASRALGGASISLLYRSKATAASACTLAQSGPATAALLAPVPVSKTPAAASGSRKVQRIWTAARGTLSLRRREVRIGPRQGIVRLVGRRGHARRPTAAQGYVDRHR